MCHTCAVAYPYPAYLVVATPPPPPARLFLPVEPKNSMEMFQVPARRWWWGLLALAALVVVTLGVTVYFAFIMSAFNPDVGGATTPSDFLINNLSIVADIGICTLIAWLFYRQGIGRLVSVVGHFRWRWFFITVGIFAACYVVELAVFEFTGSSEGIDFSQFSLQPHTWFILVSILLTTPFQCAGEEFQARALLPRLVTAIVPVKGLGLVLSAVLPAAAFMWMHDAQDPWLNLNYFCFALLTWWLAFRTGGIEASIGLHMVNNLFSEADMPFTDISDMFDRSAGQGSPMVLVDVGCVLVMVIIVTLVARKRQEARLSSPAESLATMPAPGQMASAKRYDYAPVTSLVTAVLALVSFVGILVAALIGGIDLVLLPLGVGMVCVGLAIAFGIPGIDAARNREAGHLGMAVAGLVVSGVLVLIVGVVVVVASLAAVS